VAHARQGKLISQSTRKDDKLDARTLARLARIDPQLLRPIRHRSERAQIDLMRIRVRAALVEQRTALINAARGMAKSVGERMAACASSQVSVERRKDLPAPVLETLRPLLEQIESVSAHREMRREHRADRPGTISGNRSCVAGQRSRNLDRSDVRADAGRSRPV
jgi:transposase